jgi:HK97 family phage prohead protease
MENKREIRTYGEQYQPRLRENADGSASRTIEGYAIVFGKESVLLQDWYDTYREIIEPGAITEAELATMDIKMTMYHNREKLLARSNKGVGSLRLSVDKVGVKYEFEAPNSPDGDTALELVRRGDLAGSSFTFWSDETSSVRYEMMDDDTLLRHVNHIDRVYEMTIASDPAYQQTSVTAREVTDAGIQLPGQKPKIDAEAIARREAQIKKLQSLSKK